MIKNNFSIQVQESISKIDRKKIHEVSKFLKKKITNLSRRKWGKCINS